MKFPSTNLLDCRASPPAPRRKNCGAPGGAMPEKAVPFSKSGAFRAKGAPRGGLFRMRGPFAAQRVRKVSKRPPRVKPPFQLFFIFRKKRLQQRRFDGSGRGARGGARPVRAPSRPFGRVGARPSGLSAPCPAVRTFQTGPKHRDLRIIFVSFSEGCVYTPPRFVYARPAWPTRKPFP